MTKKRLGKKEKRRLLVMMIDLLEDYINSSLLFFSRRDFSFCIFLLVGEERLKNYGRENPTFKISNIISAFL
jgi:hypothetical protein